MAKSEDGSERLPGEPVILTLAFSMEEWAILSASLMSVKIRAEEAEKVRGVTMPDDIKRMMDVGQQFMRMVKDEMKRLGQ